jgi:AcrR family transcriptional regulator
MARIDNSRSAARKPPTKKTRTTPRKTAIQARSQATVETILRATAHILVREGYDTLSTNRVAERAGVSVGSLYQYFPNKASLVSALLHRHVDDMLATIVAEAPTLMTLRLEPAIRRFVELMIEAHRVDPALHRVFVEQMPRIGDLSRIESVQERGIALARAYLTLHAEEIRPCDLDLAAFMVVVTIEAVTHGAVLSKPELLARPELIDEATTLVVKYLTAA